MVSRIQQIEKIAKNTLVKWLLIFAGSTVVALFWTWQIYLMAISDNREMHWRKVIPYSLVFWYSWAAFSPIIVWLCRRFRVDRKQLTRNLVVHGLASLVVAFGHQVFMELVLMLLDRSGPKPPFSLQLVPYILSDQLFTSDVIIYWMILFANHALEFYRRYSDGELRTSHLESQLAQAELRALKMQLQPHFLFNTLHAISALIHQDPEAADSMIARLSDLLRLTLHNVGHQEVLLKQELELLQKYLEIEQSRFRDRLKVEIGVDPGTLDARVPNLILQPLVENAIRHGIAAKADAGRIQIKSTRDNGMLRIQIIDDGPGLPNGQNGAVKEGVGLSNTRARLQQLYGERYKFEMANGDKGGLRISLVIPFHAGSNGSK
jgi:two-component system LytT family sensor kinase